MQKHVLILSKLEKNLKTICKILNNLNRDKNVIVFYPQ